MLVWMLLLSVFAIDRGKSLTPDLFASYGLPVSQDVLDKYGYFSAKERERMKQQVKEMFYLSYDSYLQYAFPLDELDPVHCRGRGPDWNNPSNININDVLGNYSLTLIDSLDALFVFGNISEFHRAVNLVTSTVSFDQDVTVQVFEATIRVVGGLLSAHLLLTTPSIFGDALTLPSYDNELLDLARDLTDRLSDALHSAPDFIPYPRVNLRHGLQMTAEKMEETCLAGAGSLVVEFGLVSRLTGDPVFEKVARRAMEKLWDRRDKVTGLLGNGISVTLGEWIEKYSGIGAGMDSFYEYLLKAHILFGDDDYLQMWNEAYSALREHTKIGGDTCGADTAFGSHPLFANVHMDRGAGALHSFWIDSLGAAFPAVQLLGGHVEDAICLHNVYANLWRVYGALPERFDWLNQKVDIPLYPLRPELAESTYFLYRATKNPFYLWVGKWMVEGIERLARCQCGYATVHSILDGSLEDRMESFFLSETLKYLYLLFDEGNPVNALSERILFTTEGHIIPILSKFRQSPADPVVTDPTKQLNFTLTDQICSVEPDQSLLQFALPVREIPWKTPSNGAPTTCSAAT